MPKKYAVYKSNELIVVGTLEECAKVTGLTKQYIFWLSSQLFSAESNVKLELSNDDSDRFIGGSLSWKNKSHLLDTLKDGLKLIASQK